MFTFIFTFILTIKLADIIAMHMQNIYTAYATTELNCIGHALYSNL